MDKYLEIDETSTTPIWIQLKNRLIYLIMSGHYKPGDKLPTVRDVAIDLKINYNTVNKVYQNLIHDGYLTSQRGKGTFVRDVTRRRSPDQDSPADSLIDMTIRQCLNLGVPLDDITNQVAKRVEKFRNAEEPSE